MPCLHETRSVQADSQMRTILSLRVARPCRLLPRAPALFRLESLANSTRAVICDVGIDTVGLGFIHMGAAPNSL